MRSCMGVALVAMTPARNSNLLIQVENTTLVNNGTNMRNDVVHESNMTDANKNDHILDKLMLKPPVRK